MSHMVTPHDEQAVQTGGLDNRKFGMWLFLATEVMFFSALIGGFINMQVRSPADANEVLNIPVTAVNTFVLIVSSFAVVMALSGAQDGSRTRARNWLALTVVLGATFLSVQFYEYTQLILHEGFTPSSGLFSGGFFTVTGFHGLHVLIGVVWAIGLLVQNLRSRVDLGLQAARLEVFGLYWHFVDVVWIILFTLIYLL